jgi:hypothetical protein
MGVTMRVSEIAALMLCAGLLAPACENAPAPAPAQPVASASVVPLYVPPPLEGCARTGSLEALETDPSCIVARGNDETAMREAMKHLTFELNADAPVVVAGGTTVLRLAITNTSASEVALMLQAQPTSAGSRPDWTRLAGVPEPKPAVSGVLPPDVYRLAMPVRTLDASEHVVDGLPITPPSGATPVLRSLRVRLRAGGKLTQTFTWWAMRIPTPGSIFRDDAGIRHVPKTAPVPLAPGQYQINVELPLGGIVPPESTVSVRVRVDKPDKLP